MALVDIGISHAELVAAGTAAYPPDLQKQLNLAITPDRLTTVHELASLDIEVGQHFAAAANRFFELHKIDSASIVAIGSHGQTLRHYPRPPTPYSWQIGNPATIAAITGITTVADFRSMDVAFGGEGAPLVPPFHNWFFGKAGQERILLNVGGIANVSVLHGSPSAHFIGYDTGPGNCLMDEWCRLHLEKPFDHAGAWASSGSVLPALLQAMLRDSYFDESPPKSTGREQFNLKLVERLVAENGLGKARPEDIQATLAQLTAESIATEIERSAAELISPVFVCGGGAHNDELMRRLRQRLPSRQVETTAAVNLDPDFVEATAFAWLAQQRTNLLPVTLSTSAAVRTRCLGAIYEPRSSA